MKLSTALLRGNVYTANVAAGSGGGAKVSHEAATIDGSVFSGNAAGENGGALELDESASAVDGCTFAGNTAAGGRAVHVAGGWDPATFEDSDFADNVATQRGGHVLIEDEEGTTRFVRVTMARGTAVDGGALLASGASVAVANTLILNNGATGSGGGIVIEAASGRLTNIVAWENAGPGGSSLRVVDGLGLDVSNSVFGRGRQSAAIVRLGGARPTWDHNDMYANDDDFFGLAPRGVFEGNLAVRPHFTDDATLDFSLRARSELIDAGSPWVFDPDGTRSDIGVFGGPESLSKNQLAERVLGCVLAVGVGAWRARTGREDRQGRTVAWACHRTSEREAAEGSRPAASRRAGCRVTTSWTSSPRRRAGDAPGAGCARRP